MAKFTGHTITNDSALGDAKIQRSLRFNDADSTYLRKSDFGSPDSGTTFTFSAWVKRTELGTWTTIAGSHSGTNAFNVFGVNSNDRLIWRIRNSSSVDLTRIQSENLLRDTNAWYHLLLERNSTLSTAGDRAKLYINGVRVTEFDQNNTDEEDQSYSSDFLQDINIGRFQVSSSQVYYGGMYLAEYHYVDGQALDPSYFGFTDPVTGAWMPKRYEGTHGTNGFYLDFSDNSSTTALGIDKSPNGNDFTPNNFSTSPGVGNDSVIDTPSNNFCTLNPLYLTGGGGTIDNGNLDFTGDANYSTRAGTFSLKTGKWYWECTPKSTPSDAAPQAFGIVRGADRVGGNTYIGYDPNSNIYGFGYFNSGAIKGDGADGTTSGNNMVTGQTTYTLDDIIGLASDIENGTLSFYKNGTLVYTITGIGSHEWFPAQTTYGTSSKNSANFGQRTISMILNGQFDPTNIPPMDYTSLLPKLLERINKTDKYKDNPLKLNEIKKKWYGIPLGLNDAQLEEYFLTGEDPRLKDKDQELIFNLKDKKFPPSGDEKEPIWKRAIQILPGDQSNLPIDTPPVSQEVVQTSALPSNINKDTGLTTTEEALLSNTEKALRRKQRNVTV